MAGAGRRLQEVVEQTVRSQLRRLAARWPVILGTTLLVVPALITFMCAMVLIGAWRDDLAIAARTGRATAEVVSVDPSRTIIRFTTPDGAVQSPPNGVLYPRDLEPGQLVRIEYDASNPDLARVAGRDVSLGFLPAGLTALASWLVFAPAGLWLRRSGVR
jgi:hypothetical protein